jgi:hypothetical protein
MNGTKTLQANGWPLPLHRSARRTTDHWLVEPPLACQAVASFHLHMQLLHCVARSAKDFFLSGSPNSLGTYQVFYYKLLMTSGVIYTQHPLPQVGTHSIEYFKPQQRYTTKRAFPPIAIIYRQHFKFLPFSVLFKAIAHDWE